MVWCSRTVGFVILLANCWNFCDGTGCPGRWKSYNSSCYYFSKSTLTWTQAFDQCKQLQGYMAEIEDSDENAFIASILRANNYYNYYIGLSDRGEEGTWKWMTSGKHLEFSSWRPGEPNSYGGEEDCVNYDNPSEWNDKKCSTQLRYICETGANECFSNPCMNNGTCKDGANHYTCDCVVGYEGTNCQNNINECFSNPCINGGMCSGDVNGYTCDCATGFVGTNCQTESSAVTGTGKASVPVYVFAAVVSVFVLLIVAGVVSIIIWRKWFKNRSNSAENQTIANSIQGTAGTKPTAREVRRARLLRLGNASGGHK